MAIERGNVKQSARGTLDRRIPTAIRRMRSPEIHLPFERGGANIVILFLLPFNREREMTQAKRV